jgi:acyl-CoA hydrolase
LNGKEVAESRVTLTQLMGVEAANTLGHVHGGYIMKLSDEAGGMAATRHARRPCVTVAVDSMTFDSPIQIGNLVTVEAEVTWTGRSSIETRVVVTAEDVMTGKVTNTNTAYIVYVALGSDGRPTEVPEIIRRSDEEKARFERAAARQKGRLRSKKKNQ